MTDQNCPPDLQIGVNTILSGILRYYTGFPSWRNSRSGLMEESISWIPAGVYPVLDTG